MNKVILSQGELNIIKDSIKLAMNAVAFGDKATKAERKAALSSLENALFRIGQAESTS
jgi:hypothetical protein